MKTCVCVDVSNRLLGPREPIVGEFFIYEYYDDNQFPYLVYDKITCEVLYRMTEKGFNRHFKDLEKIREEKLNQILE